MVQRVELLQYLNDLLKPEQFKDYCPNGLQIEGTDTIEHLVTGVTACQALIDQTAQAKASALLVHHGFFWKNEAPQLVGMKHHRVKTLIQNDINLIGYHLPLDAHPTLGNNAQLASQLKLSIDQTFGDQNLAVAGNIDISTKALSDRLCQVLSRPPEVFGASRQIKRLGICTGAAQGFLTQAAELGLDAFISGEVSESTFHIAEELNIQYFAAGHHATERFGVQAVGAHLAEHFGISHQFIDINNPI
ncbi:MAG: Nif3-like dinuclear metal center hexameric protein [Methylococcales bacterium]|nr:Nif3-like dinuclear metal center hexameric protein [Methylococcales bacterium]MBT7444876.1 Nif3-like dinuclear metal center hexameric protein [Methylococcales bacterium]